MKWSRHIQFQILCAHKSTVPICYEVNFFPTPTNSYIKVLTPSVIVYGSEAFKEALEVIEVIRVGP